MRGIDKLPFKKRSYPCRLNSCMGQKASADPKPVFSHQRKVHLQASIETAPIKFLLKYQEGDETVTLYARLSGQQDDTYSAICPGWSHTAVSRSPYNQKSSCTDMEQSDKTGKYNSWTPCQYHELTVKEAAHPACSAPGEWQIWCQ